VDGFWDIGGMPKTNYRTNGRTVGLSKSYRELQNRRKIWEWGMEKWNMGNRDLEYRGWVYII
jgi:hypothetical protein